MSEMTEEEFLSIWQNSMPAIPVEPEFRLYYDDNGFPLFYSMENQEGLYVKVDQETFINGPKNIRVIDGKIIEAQVCWTKKIVPSTRGQSCDPRDVCVVVSSDQPHINWRLKHEEPKYDQTH